MGCEELKSGTGMSMYVLYYLVYSMETPNCYV